MVGDRMLVTVNRDADEVFHLMPGGGQEFGEDARAGLVRECREELGCEVVARDIACVRDYVGRNHRPDAWDVGFHQQENLWWTDLAPGAEPRFDPATGDRWQVGVAWLTIEELRQREFSPRPLLDWLETEPSRRPFYLGDVI